MNQPQIVEAQKDAHAVEDEISVLEILSVLGRHKKLIFALPLAAAVLAGAISFALPKIYRATTTLLPPQGQSGAAAIMSQLGGSAGFLASAAGIKNPNDLYVGMLTSRTVGEKLIAQFDLKKRYRTDSQEKALARLKEATSISAGKDGLITINVEDEDKKLAAPMANAYVDQLLQLTRTLAVTEAAQRRLFFERQLELAKNNLATAEVDLKRGLDTNGVVSIDNESRAIVETVGRLRAQIAAKEIQIGSMQAFVTTNNQAYKQAQEELSSLRDQLSKLENGGATSAGNSSEGAPRKQGGLESIKLLRDVKYYQMLYELLAKQYEAARLDEAREASVVQVLDRAVEPESKVKPKRAFIVLLGGILGLIVAVAVAFFREFRPQFTNLLGRAPSPRPLAAAGGAGDIGPESKRV